jgi:hypothetical protein
MLMHPPALFLIKKIEKQYNGIGITWYRTHLLDAFSILGVIVLT